MKLIIYTERVRRRGGGTYKSSDEWKIMSSSFFVIILFPLFFFFFFFFYFISHSSTILLVLDLYQSKVSLNWDRNKREKEMMEKLWIVKLPRSETKNDEYKCQLCMNNPCATKWTISQILTIISWMPFSFFFFFLFFFVLLPSIQSWSKKQSIFSFFFCLHFKTKSLSYQIKKQEKKERNIWTTKMKNMKQMHEPNIRTEIFLFFFAFLFDQWLTENKRETKNMKGKTEKNAFVWTETGMENVTKWHCICVCIMDSSTDKF